MTDLEKNLEIKERHGKKLTSQSFRNLFDINSSENPEVVWKINGSNPRVLFVYHNDIEEGFIHPALAVLGGMMRDNNIESRLFDTSFMRDKNSPHAENVRELRERIGEERPSGYTFERRLVDLKEEFYKTVEEYRPDLIALTSTSYDFKPATEFILPTKKKFGIPVIVGGPHATVAPDRAIANDAIDIVCIGEGEKSLLNLIQNINQGRSVSNIPSLWVKDKWGRIHKNRVGRQIEEMDDLPLPNWDMFDERHRLRPFMGKVKNFGYWEISRGCPFSCSYCIQAALHEIPSEGGNESGRYKYHSAEEIVRRMKVYTEKYGSNHFQLIDENLPTMKKSELEKIADLFIKEIKRPFNMEFFTMSRPEYIIRKALDKNGFPITDRHGNQRYVSSGKAEILAAMGCKMVAMGAESGNEWLREHVLNRPMAQGRLEAASEILMENGIQVSLYNIIGFPFETREMMFDTIKQLWRIKPDRYSVRHMSPYPGTPIRDLCEEKGYIDKFYEDIPPQISKSSEGTKLIGGSKSFLHEPALNLPRKINRSEVVSKNPRTERYVTMEHPSLGEFIEHPSNEEQMRIRQLFGIYGFSPTEAMWKIIELAEDRGLAKGHKNLQDMVYQSFLRARSNRSEDEDSDRPDLNVREITYNDIIGLEKEETRFYLGRPRALLPLVELALGKGYASKIPGLQEYVRNVFKTDYEERIEKDLSLSEARNREDLSQIGATGIMMSSS